MNEKTTLICGNVPVDVKEEFYKALSKSWDKSELEDAKNDVLTVLLKEYINRQKGDGQ